MFSASAGQMGLVVTILRWSLSLVSPGVCDSPDQAAHYPW
jgi:hypothetical protein